MPNAVVGPIQFLFDARVRRFLQRMHRSLRQDPQYRAWRLLNTTKDLFWGQKFVCHNGAYYVSLIMPPIPSRMFTTYLNAVIDPRHMYQEHAYWHRTAPITCTLAVTERCRFQCLYCSASGRTPTGELPTEAWLSIIHDLQAMNTPVIHFTGGEPLLREDLTQLVASIDGRSTSFVFTSGDQLTQEKALALKTAGLTGIVVSLDTADPEAYNARRGSSTAFQIALQALRAAVGAGLYVGLTVVVTKDMLSAKRLFPLFRLAAQFGVQEVLLKPVVRAGRFLTQPERSALHHADFQRLIALQDAGNRAFPTVKINSEAYMLHHMGFGCAAGIHHSYINAAGELFPCDFLPLSFGSALDGNLPTLWRVMCRIIAMPHSSCFAERLSTELVGCSLPLTPQQSEKLCNKHREVQCPSFYKKLRGE